MEAESEEERVGRICGGGEGIWRQRRKTKRVNAEW
tara:strand:+ start:178 stop:282 length:105 start_codon:yes stop_codon:yes gene_type:complete